MFLTVHRFIANIATLNAAILGSQRVQVLHVSNQTKTNSKNESADGKHPSLSELGEHGPAHPANQHEIHAEPTKAGLVFPHPYHLVDLSPWPAMTSLSLLCLACGLVLYFHQYPAGGLLLCVALVTLAYAASLWWRDVIRESTLGFHTSRVKEGLHLGMILFIVSEAVFFVGVRRRAAIHAVGEITTCTVFA
jgi:hypothetical protein